MYSIIYISNLNYIWPSSNTDTPNSTGFLHCYFLDDVIIDYFIIVAAYIILYSSRMTGMSRRTSIDRTGYASQRRKLGKRIRELRRRRGWSQATLAKLCGIHGHHLGKIERGEANATLATLLKIARNLKKTLSDLFQGIS